MFDNWGEHDVGSLSVTPLASASALDDPSVQINLWKRCEFKKIKTIWILLHKTLPYIAKKM